MQPNTQSAPAASHPAEFLTDLTTASVDVSISDEQKQALASRGLPSQLQVATERLQKELVAYRQSVAVLRGEQQPPILRWPTGNGEVPIDIATMVRAVSADKMQSQLEAIVAPCCAYLFRAVARSVAAMEDTLRNLCLLHGAHAQVPDAQLRLQGQHTAGSPEHKLGELLTGTHEIRRLLAALNSYDAADLVAALHEPPPFPLHGAPTIERTLLLLRQAVPQDLAALLQKLQQQADAQLHRELATWLISTFAAAQQLHQQLLPATPGLTL